METLTTSLFSDLEGEVRRAIMMSQPDLDCSVSGDKVTLQGDFHVYAKDPERAAHGPLATYRIRVELDHRFPEMEPKVFETGKAFPHDDDHHINPDDSCCFGVWELLRLEKPQMTVREFLDGPVTGHFFGQHYFAKTGKWPFGELSHGPKGLVEAYSERLGCPTKLDVVLGMLRILSKKWKRDRHRCPCGSGRRIRDCCRPHLDAMPAPIYYRDARPLLRRLDVYQDSAR